LKYIYGGFVHSTHLTDTNTMVYPKVSGLSHKEIYAYNIKHSLRSNIKGYGGITQ